MYRRKYCSKCGSPIEGPGTNVCDECHYEGVSHLLDLAKKLKRSILTERLNDYQSPTLGTNAPADMQSRRIPGNDTVH